MSVVETEETKQAAKGAQHAGLDQKLTEDLFAGRAHSLAQADLEGALGHTDEHDIHHHDPADDQRDERDWYHYRGNAAGELIDLVVERLHIHQAKIVLVVSFQPVLVAHADARIVNRGRKILARLRLAMNLQTIAPEDLQVRSGRNVDVAIK